MHLFIIILKEADTGFEHTKFVSVSFNLLVIQNHNIDGGGRYEGKDSIKLWQIIVKWAKKIHLYRCNKIVVREKGLEPPRLRRQILSLVRLPIPPLPHGIHFILSWYRQSVNR